MAGRAIGEAFQGGISALISHCSFASAVRARSGQFFCPSASLPRCASVSTMASASLKSARASVGSVLPAISRAQEIDRFAPGCRPGIGRRFCAQDRCTPDKRRFRRWFLAQGPALREPQVVGVRSRRPQIRHALALDARRIGATNLMAMLSAGGEATARFLVCGVFLEEWARAATGSYRPQDDHSSDQHEGSIEPLVKQC